MSWIDELPELKQQRIPYSSEDAYFMRNPAVSGMATEDNRIILNPHSKLSEAEKRRVAQNEAIRLAMRTAQVEPIFDLTDKQRAFYKGTPYENAPLDARNSTIARMLVGDPSAQDVTPQQIQYGDVLRDMLVNRPRFTVNDPRTLMTPMFVPLARDSLFKRLSTR